MTGIYAPGLVALSVAIAILSSYATLDIVGRVAASTGRHRSAWLSGGSAAMGTGIWSMHYIGMLAFSLPVSVAYDLPAVIVSLLAAMAASYVALLVASDSKLSLLRTFVASLLMGGGISGMHYIGMAAMRLPATCHWSLPLVCFSIVLAVAISFVALRFAFHFRNDSAPRSGQKLVSSILMGSAIPVMHYTGMAAAHFVAAGPQPSSAYAVSISALGMVSISCLCAIILGFTLLLAVWDRRFSAQAAELAYTEQRYRDLVESARIALWRSDVDMRHFSFVNQEGTALLGYPGRQWLEEAHFWQNHVHPQDRALCNCTPAGNDPGTHINAF